MTGKPRGSGGGDRGGRRRSPGGSGGKGSVRECESAVRDAVDAGRARVTGPDRSLPVKTVTIERKSFMPRAEFRRKANALKQLSDEEKLYKATNPVQRDSSVTKEYRQEVIDRIWKQFHERNPEFADKLIERVTKRMQPDHVWELQLGGPDDKSNLRFLDSRTNEDIGIRQIRPQIARLPDGTPIRIEVIDE